MTLGFFHVVLISGHMVLSGASGASIDPMGVLKSTVAEAADALNGAAGMMRREFEGQKADKVDAASGTRSSPESLFQVDGQEWTSTDHVPISTYFSFAEYGQRYREAKGHVQRKQPANNLPASHQKELRFFVRSLLEEAEDFEANNLLHNKAGRTQASRGPSWLHGGMPSSDSSLKFEYQSAIGRDGFEPDPTEPTCEFFGPFKLDYGAHTIYLEDWNLLIGTKLERYGMGNLVVGLNQTYEEARNGVIVGKSNILQGSYGAVAGQFNKAKGRGAVVDGGIENDAAAEYTNVNGGMKNNATIMFAVVSGGFGNSATAPFSAVGGGDNNVADGYSATAMGGSRNEALANLSAVLGGQGNIIPSSSVSETVQGGLDGNIPTPEPAKAVVIEAGQYKPERSAESGAAELNYEALGCADPGTCEQQEEEEEWEEEEEEGNPATQKRVIDVEEVQKNGDSRRRSPHGDDEDMTLSAAPR